MTDAPTLTVRVACECPGRRIPVRLLAAHVEFCREHGATDAHTVGSYRCLKCGVTMWITLGDVQVLRTAA